MGVLWFWAPKREDIRSVAEQCAANGDEKELSCTTQSCSRAVAKVMFRWGQSTCFQLFDKK